MDKNKMEDMAYQLLDISFDIAEWDEDFLNGAIREVVTQLETLKKAKEMRSMFDTTIDLWDLLTEAYERNCFVYIG